MGSPDVNFYEMIIVKMMMVLRTLNQHRAKLWLRISVFAAVLLWLCIRPDQGNDPIRSPIRGYHFLWGIGMLEMALVFFPRIAPGASCGRVYNRHYIPAHHDPVRIRKQVRQSNHRLWGVIALWLLCLACLGSALWLKLIERVHMVFAAASCSLLDQLFVNLGCPLRSWIMKNKCCTTCRIYSWGFAMMFSPLLFIPSFWTYSLVAVAACILIRWEIAYARHPERFSEISNKALRCSRCANPCRRVEKVRHLPLPLDIPDEQTGIIG